MTEVAEVITALDDGLTLLKFFPAETSGGAPAIRALSAAFPQVRFVPTGGVSAANATDYLAIPSVAAVGGSWITPPQLIADRDFEAIAALATAAASLRATSPA